MGERNLTIVYSDGEYKIAQYDHWGADPSLNGIKCLEFAQKLSDENTFNKFKEMVSKAKFFTVDEIENLTDYDGSAKDYPQFTIKRGTEILDLILNNKNKDFPVYNSITFAADSLFCEWAYLINLDDKTLEIYKGFNTEPLTPDDRFYFLKYYESTRIHNIGHDIGNDGKVQYHGIKLAKSYPLYNLPDNDEFLKDLCGK